MCGPTITYTKHCVSDLYDRVRNEKKRIEKNTQYCVRHLVFEKALLTTLSICLAHLLFIDYRASSVGCSELQYL